MPAVPPALGGAPEPDGDAAVWLEPQGAAAGAALPPLGGAPLDELDELDELVSPSHVQPIWRLHAVSLIPAQGFALPSHVCESNSGVQPS